MQQTRMIIKKLGGYLECLSSDIKVMFALYVLNFELSGMMSLKEPQVLHCDMRIALLLPKWRGVR